MIDQKKIEVQAEGYLKWVDSGENSILEMATGTGKTWVALRAMLHNVSQGGSVLFLAERVGREAGVRHEINKFNTHFNVNILAGVELEFACYQAAYKWSNKHWNLVIADEVHEVGEQYVRFFKNNTYDKFMGLTATLNNNSEYTIGSRRYTKREFLETFVAPVSFTYSLSQAQEGGVSRKAKVYFLEHTMFEKNKTIKISPNYFVTERESYNYWSKLIDDTYEIGKNEEIPRFPNDKERAIIKKAQLMRASLLYKISSKVHTTKEVIKRLKGRTIVFMNSLETLKLITPFAVGHKIPKSQEIIERFRNKEIDLIGSFKLIQQGENFPDVDNCIISSYYSSDGPLIQRIGRLRSADSEGTIVILYTKDTVEEEWIEKFLNELSSYEIIKIKSVDEIKI